MCRAFSIPFLLLNSFRLCIYGWSKRVFELGHELLYFIYAMESSIDVSVSNESWELGIFDMIDLDKRLNS